MTDEESRKGFRKKYTTHNITNESKMSEFKWIKVGTFFISSDGKISFVDHIFSDILGYEDYNRLLGKNIRTLCYNDKDKKKILPAKTDDEVGEIALNSEVLFKKEDGSAIPVSLTLIKT